jgi:hypothetical protein
MPHGDNEILLEVDGDPFWVTVEELYETILWTRELSDREVFAIGEPGDEILALFSLYMCHYGADKEYVRKHLRREVIDEEISKSKFYLAQRFGIALPETVGDTRTTTQGTPSGVGSLWRAEAEFLIANVQAWNDPYLNWLLEFSEYETEEDIFISKNVRFDLGNIDFDNLEGIDELASDSESEEEDATFDRDIEGEESLPYRKDIHMTNEEFESKGEFRE